MNQIVLPISVKAIMWRGKSVLFLKNPRGEWELPGGRPEPGEDEPQTVIREVKEECGFEITSARPIGRQVCEVLPGKWVDIRFFDCDFVQDTPNLSDEHTDARWIPIEESRPRDLPEFYWAACVHVLQQKYPVA
ncbi:NUDIX domain-containing protein [Dyella choica]|uniref:NUDIX domain-containing protein n=1 Tax=Dyella choica TaxID=1927959 RepID=A0A3S0PKN2_9GAMM|nr:NUDIX domain-containing protein [Dyella choica]RUL73066.1 NUDIX domain-containing protein [Dyella choica]